MDAKVIILLVFILFGMIVAYMVANGMVDLTSIFSRVTKSQAEENLGGVKLQIDSPVAGVYYQATGNALELVKIKDTDDDSGGSIAYEYDMIGLVKISGKNLNGKTLTISVASPNWYLEEDTDGDGTFDITGVKTVQLKIMVDGDHDSDGEYFLVPTSITDLTTYVGNNDTGNSGTNPGEVTVVQLVRQTGSGIEPFDLPEFVELIFAVGETAKAEVTIVAEP